MDNVRNREAHPDLDGLAARALAYLARDEERLGDFLALTGLTVPTLRAAAAQPGFTRGILSYIVADERLFLAFCAVEEGSPEVLAGLIHRAVAPGETGAL